MTKKLSVALAVAGLSFCLRLALFHARASGTGWTGAPILITEPIDETRLVTLRRQHAIRS